MQSFRVVTMTLLAVAMFGCASHGPFDDWPGLEGAASRASDLAVLHEDEGAASSPTAAAIDAASGPEAFVQLAMERNPAIRAAKQKIERLAQRIPQVTSLGDPMFNVAPIGEMAETAAGQAGLMTGVSQKLPFPGKLSTRGRVAGQRVAAAAQDLEATKLQVIADTRQAYWSHYFAVRAIEVTEQSRELISQFKQIAEAKNKAGTASQQDVLRASVELSNLDNELITWRQRRTTAAAMLNSLIDRLVTAEIPTPSVASAEAIAIDLDRLLTEAEQINPAIRKVREQVEERRQRLKLARLNRYPDLTAMINYVAVDDEGMSMAANGKDQWWLGFGVNLPIWTEKLDAVENEARHGIMESLANLNNAHNRVAFRVQDASVKVDTQQRLTILFRDVIVPQAQQTVDASFSSYRAGKVEFLTVVDNWRKLLNFQLMYHQSLAQLEKDFAALQQTVGRDLERK